jgi:LPS export ABC transporter protein LptC
MKYTCRKTYNRTARISLANPFIHMAIQTAALAVAILAALPGCTKNEKDLPQASDSVSVLYQEAENTSMSCYDGPHKLWRLDTDYMRRELSDTAQMLAVPVKITTFDTTGKAMSIILSDSGRTGQQMERFFIWGNVYIKTSENMIIRSQSLWWEKNTHKVGSDDFVQIKTPEGDVLRGKGLDANESFSRWSLRKNVSGHFPNFRERFEKDDKGEPFEGKGKPGDDLDQ